MRIIRIKRKSTNKKQTMHKYLFHVNGIHCKSCVALIENELGKLPEVTKVKASLKHFNVEVVGDFGDKTPEHIARDLTEVIKPHGYSLSIEKQKNQVNWSDFNVALPIAAGFIFLFFVLQKLGIVNLVSASNIGYGTAFVVGLVASVSTCMAVVGGLVLAMSANFAKDNDKIKPQVMFHAGRLVSFFILGGAIGAIGSSFQLGTIGSFVLSFIVAIIMLILGINLLDIFPWFKKLQPALPGFIGKKINDFKNIHHIFTPLLVGVATFFLPCGFTQAMQIYALSTENFLTGGLTMLVFALGTLPVLALLSFGSLKIHSKEKSGIFFKTAGLVVIFFGLFNLINSLAAIGLIPPVFNF